MINLEDLKVIERKYISPTNHSPEIIKADKKWFKKNLTKRCRRIFGRWIRRGQFRNGKKNEKMGILNLSNEYWIIEINNKFYKSNGNDRNILS
jgi:hypothetical protein